MGGAFLVVWLNYGLHAMIPAPSEDACWAMEPAIIAEIRASEPEGPDNMLVISSCLTRNEVSDALYLAAERG